MHGKEGGAEGGLFSCMGFCEGDEQYAVVVEPVVFGAPDIIGGCTAGQCSTETLHMLQQLCTQNNQTGPPMH